MDEDFSTQIQAIDDLKEERRTEPLGQLSRSSVGVGLVEVHDDDLRAPALDKRSGEHVAQSSSGTGDNADLAVERQSLEGPLVVALLVDVD